MPLCRRIRFRATAADEDPGLIHLSRKTAINPLFSVAFWGVFRLLFALYWLRRGFIVSFPVKSPLRPDSPDFTSFTSRLLPLLPVLLCCACRDTSGSRSVPPENFACSDGCSSGRHGCISGGRWTDPGKNPSTVCLFETFSA